MNEEIVKDFLKYSFSKEWPTKLNWWVMVFTEVLEDFENEMFKKDGSKFYYKKDDELILLTDKYKEKLIPIKFKIEIEPGFPSNNSKRIETTVGRICMNWLIGVYALHNKIPYINDVFTVSDIEKKYIKPLLTDDPNQIDKIQIKEYKKFLDAVLLIDSMSKYLSVMASPKAVTPPKGIEQYKKKLIEEYTKKYGKEKLKDPKIVAEIEAKLKEYDAEYLKGDIADSKLPGGKVKNMARKRMYLSFGLGNDFNNDPTPVLNSLSEGIDINNKEQITAYINDSRAGSFGRGAETQQGGVVAKDTLRATSDIKVEKGDCGSKITLPILVTKDNMSSLVGRFILDKGKVIELTTDNISDYLNQVVNLRTALYCKLDHNFCSTCLGSKIADYENGIALLASGLGGQILSIALKKFHGNTLSLADIDFDQELR